MSELVREFDFLSDECSMGNQQSDYGKNSQNNEDLG